MFFACSGVRIIAPSYRPFRVLSAFCVFDDRKRFCFSMNREECYRRRVREEIQSLGAILDTLEWYYNLQFEKWRFQRSLSRSHR